MDQFPQLIEALGKVATAMEHSSKSEYTITGASDWGILLVMSGVLAVAFGIISTLFWRYLDKSFEELKVAIRDHRGEWKVELDKHMVTDKEEKNLLWNETRTIRQEMKECKEKCCG